MQFTAAGLFIMSSSNRGNEQNTYIYKPRLMRLHASRLPKMMEALLNLIVNALDAVSDNGSVQIILTKSNEQFVVSIIDDGCGIAPKQLLTIFHPFTTTKPDGTGLGLPVAKRIIEGHGGHIRVSSAPNQGATFTFLLPCSFSSDKK